MVIQKFVAGEREIEEKKRNCKTDKVKYLLPVTVLLYFLFYKKYFGQGPYTNSERRTLTSMISAGITFVNIIDHVKKKHHIDEMK